MTMREAPIATGARIPAPGATTVIPTVKTRKNVPMNSTRYFFMGLGPSYGARARERAFFGIAGAPESGVVAHSHGTQDPGGRLRRLHIRPGRNARRHDAAPLRRVGGRAEERRAQGEPRRDPLLRAGRLAVAQGGRPPGSPPRPRARSQEGVRGEGGPVQGLAPE